jgi:protein-disulfide isomerase
VLYVFSDLSCPHCASMFPVLKDYADRSGGSVALVFRHFPLRMHGSRAVEQALFAECIARIGGNREFWFALGELFSAESERAVAGSLNLDFTRISDCIRDRETAANVVRDVAEGEKLNISSTPAVVVLDRIHNVRITLENISSAGDITAAVSRIKTGLDHPTAVAE